ncbi:MAG: membrane integrity-associated transporter subunit PqiC [Magnetococcales bacterium]|nr:membrane integrity-associated transporter subunit PqiC [Magnetococcales bacterium]
MMFSLTSLAVSTLRNRSFSRETAVDGTQQAPRTAVSRFILWVGLLSLLGGCTGFIVEGSPPTRFFIISPLIANTVETGSGTRERELSLAVEPVDIPSYLDRPQIVIRTSQSELDISEFNLWAESLRENFSRVLVENLSLLLDSDRVFQLPGLKRQIADFRIMVRIIQFERAEDGTTRLTVRWKLYNSDATKLLFRENAVLTGQKAGKDDYPAIAESMSHLLAKFSRRIASVIRQQTTP